MVEKNRRILISKTLMVRLTGLLLYANESCGVRFIFGDD